MANPIEFTTWRGHMLRVSWLPAGRYELRFHDARSGEEWGEEISIEDKDKLVDWFGYPQESTERVAAAERAITNLEATLERSREHIEALLGELTMVEPLVRTLVDDLAGAWWLRAAEAYKGLSGWLARRP